MLWLVEKQASVMYDCLGCLAQHPTGLVRNIAMPTLAGAALASGALSTGIAITASGSSRMLEEPVASASAAGAAALAAALPFGLPL